MSVRVVDILDLAPRDAHDFYALSWEWATSDALLTELLQDIPTLTSLQAFVRTSGGYDHNHLALMFGTPRQQDAPYFVDAMPLLLVWAAALRLIVRESDIQTPVFPGLILDQGLLVASDMAPDGKGLRLYVNPDIRPAQNSHRTALDLAGWLHTSICHELVRNLGHSHHWNVAKRSCAAAIVVPLLARLVERLIGTDPLTAAALRIQEEIRQALVAQAGPQWTVAEVEAVINDADPQGCFHVIKRKLMDKYGGARRAQNMRPGRPLDVRLEQADEVETFLASQLQHIFDGSVNAVSLAAYIVRILVPLVRTNLGDRVTDLRTVQKLNDEDDWRHELGEEELSWLICEFMDGDCAQDSADDYRQFVIVSWVRVLMSEPCFYPFYIKGDAVIFPSLRADPLHNAVQGLIERVDGNMALIFSLEARRAAHWVPLALVRPATRHPSVVDNDTRSFR